MNLFITRKTLLNTLENKLGRRPIWHLYNLASKLKVVERTAEIWCTLMELSNELFENSFWIRPNGHWTENLDDFCVFFILGVCRLQKMSLFQLSWCSKCFDISYFSNVSGNLGASLAPVKPIWVFTAREAAVGNVAWPSWPITKKLQATGIWTSSGIYDVISSKKSWSETDFLAVFLQDNSTSVELEWK